MKATVQKTAAYPTRPDHHAAQRTPLTLNPAGESVVLQHAQHAQLRRARGWTVRALTGSVWITQDGDIRDVVLQPGQSFILDRQGPATLTSLDDTDARVMIENSRRTVQRKAIIPALFAPARALLA